MLNELISLKEIRTEVQDFIEEVAFQKQEFLEKLALEERKDNTISIVATITAKNLQERAFDLHKEAKCMEVSSISDFEKKEELLKEAETLMTMAIEAVESIIEEEMPVSFRIKETGELLEIKGLLKLMNQGRFNAVDSIIKEFVPFINVDEEVINLTFKMFESLDMSKVKNIEHFAEMFIEFFDENYKKDDSDVELEESNYLLAEKDEEFEGFELDYVPDEALDVEFDFDKEDIFELAEKESDESMYLLQEKESFDSDKRHEEFEQEMKKVWSIFNNNPDFSEPERDKFAL